MALISLVCPKCGRKTQADDTSDSGFCMYCGFKICIERSVPEEDARDYLAKAEQGDVSAQYKVATMYRTGQGLKQSYEEAMRWYLAAAEQGDPFAMYNISILYSSGFGVKQNCAIAAKWLKDAHDHGLDEILRKNRS
ncbi:MAG: sel1 repeat family protein [archaeon]|nr:sel1 repeat family protein [archaeon]